MYMNVVVVSSCILLLFVLIALLWLKNVKSNELSSNSIIKHFGTIPVRIICDQQSCIAGINELLSHNPCYVGFDCEWKANRVRGEKQNKICLIQIGDEKLILLIRIHLFSDTIPIELISFFEKVDIIKCGVGIYGDVNKLKKDYNIDIYGCVDLNAINIIHNETDQKIFGLETFSKEILGESMQYKHDINHDKWEDDILDSKQIHYAADDAYVAYKIFKKIIKTQYDENTNIMEICFGKIDTNLFKAKRSKYRLKQKRKESQSNNDKTNNYLKGNKHHGMINLLLPNGDLLSCIQAKMGKLFLRKKWAKKNDLSTIQLLIDVQPIDINHDDSYKFVRVLTMTDYCCIVCGQCSNNNDEDILIWHSLIPRLHSIFHKNQDDPYKVLLCKKCHKMAQKIKKIYQHELTQNMLYGEGEIEHINSLYNTRNICWNLKHRKKRYSYSVQQQNEFVQKILAYCNIENREEIVIKECDFNDELGIDWYRNDKEYNYVVIKECINKICTERRKNRTIHNDKLKQSLSDLWKYRKIQYAEMWRINFMKKMKPKYANYKYETFEIDIDKTMNENKFLIERKCKHKIVDINGDLLTRTTLKFSDKLCGHGTDEKKYDDDDDNVAAMRVGGKTVQLLNDIKPVDISEHHKGITFIIWVPFAEIKCFHCNSLYDDDILLKIYNIFPTCYYDKLCANYDDFENDYNMQYHVPLCVECEKKAVRIQNEFELYLYGKYNLLNTDENELEFYVVQLSQKEERYRLSTLEQNGYIKKILNHFNIIDDEIIIEEYHCNKEIDIDWYYIEEYNYIIIKECMDKLIERNKSEFTNKLCAIFKQNELQFIKLWIDNFVGKMRLNLKTINSAFQI